MDPGSRAAASSLVGRYRRSVNWPGTRSHVHSRQRHQSRSLGGRCPERSGRGPSRAHDASSLNPRRPAFGRAVQALTSSFGSSATTAAGYGPAGQDERARALAGARVRVTECEHNVRPYLHVYASGLLVDEPDLVAGRAATCFPGEDAQVQLHMHRRRMSRNDGPPTPPQRVSGKLSGGRNDTSSYWPIG
jgi:hypothetical protein